MDGPAGERSRRCGLRQLRERQGACNREARCHLVSFYFNLFF